MMKRSGARSALTALVFGLTLFANASPGLEPEERLADPALEARARDLSRELRCLVCQGQTIDDSNAPVARALRTFVRERISAGDDDEAVLAAVTQRYGASVRLRPAWTAQTALLWGGPLIVLVLGGVGAIGFIRRSAETPDASPLTPEEKAKLAQHNGPA